MDRPWRKVVVPDHVWDAFEAMARDMGNERDALISQALFTFARQNGYLQPSKTAAPEEEADPFGEVPADEPIAKRRDREPRMAAGAPAPMPLVDHTDPEQHDRPTKVRPPGGLSIHPGVAELVLLADDGSQLRVTKERFVIGRGKHCDLVINSTKVSREHAHILHEGDAHYIEDLDSSNGTWFDKARIRRRKIEDGDEYFICNERLKCQLLPPGA
jgi:hypothetical protein